MFGHIIPLNAIIGNAILYGLPLSKTFNNLQSAFGSIPHQLILDTLHHILVHSQIRTYVADMNSKLTASISTGNWCTFQGDTFSPLLFLFCYHPVIAYAEKLPTTVFRCLPHYQNQLVCLQLTLTFIWSGRRTNLKAKPF